MSNTCGCGGSDKFPTPGPVPCLSTDQRLGSCWPPGFLFISKDDDGVMRLWVGDGWHGRALAFIDEVVTPKMLCDAIDQAINGGGS